ncbi:hypothetical protein UPYG_G00244370 [Umbra pygmaea]|uniref:PH domain-containing protein n=1 Tax=Umbra pygmaea TaxID=75934 RepID=A0ABD0WG74_UMBPY
MSGGADVVCQGWLRKSPPEKKLRRYAWKKRWFVLRSGRLTGDPDVLEYYKHDHARKPIRIIDMSLCEQVDAGLTFNKKDLDSSYVFDVRTLDRVFYLVADSQEDMNRWVRCICDLCGFNPTDNERPTFAAEIPIVTVTTGHAPISLATSSITVPATYESVSVRHLESPGNQENGGTDYLWLSHCQSKTPHRPPIGSTSSDTTDNDNNENNLPSHWTPPSSSSSSSSPASLANGLPFHPHTTPWAVTKETNHLLSHSQDSVATPELRRGWTRGHPSPHPRKHSLQLQPVSLPPLCNDTFFTKGGVTTIKSQSFNGNSSSTYQVPRLSSTSTAGSDTPGESCASTPPPRPPKPLLSAPAEVSPLGTTSATLPVPTSEPQRSAGERGGDRGVERGGERVVGGAPSCEACQECSHVGSPESYVAQRTVIEQSTSSLFDFSDSFNSYFINKGMVPLTVHAENEEVDDNYVPMSTSNPSLACLPPSSFFTPLPDPPSKDTNYVSMTPCPSELPSLGRQVPPPAHLVFRTSPVTLHTPPLRRHTTGGGVGRGAGVTQPPPIHRNLKPRKVKPAPLDIRPLQEWEELPAPVRSPVTQTFTRDPSSYSPCPSGKPSSYPSSASSSDSEDLDDNYVAMTTSSIAPAAVEPTLRGNSPMTLRRPKDKHVEYLDLDLHTGRVATPPRQKKSVLGGLMGCSESERARERVDYVVVDPERTRALKSTREAWHDGRQSTEKEK